MKLKKLAGVALAAVMVCAMGMSALAAGSPSTDLKATGTDSNGNAVEVVVRETTQEAPDTTIIKGLVNNYTDTMKIVALKDVSVIGTGQVDYPVTITFSYPGVNINTKVAVLHWSGTEWENIDATAGDGTITAKFFDLSPVAIIVDSATMTQPSAGTGSGATSPNTGESSVVFALGIVALVAACGALGLSKKRA